VHNSIKQLVLAPSSVKNYKKNPFFSFRGLYYVIVTGISEAARVVAVWRSFAGSASALAAGSFTKKRNYTFHYYTKYWVKWTVAKGEAGCIL
jgi:hypothetical protein